MQTAAQFLGVELHVARASAPDKFESAFARVIAGRADALIILADEMFINNHPRILAFTDFNRLPALFPKKEIAVAGGLMAYGPSLPANRGANAADLPIDRPTKFEFAINLKAARALALTVPPTLLAIADEVIE
jgi:putative ABC transport system substrate-binding protein